jgi:hypothetical protein
VLGGPTHSMLPFSVTEQCSLTPSTPQIPVDPNLANEQAQAQSELVSGLQTQTQDDMASLMARYGTQLALAGTTIAPMASPTAVAANKAA